MMRLAITDTALKKKQSAAFCFCSAGVSLRKILVKKKIIRSCVRIPKIDNGTPKISEKGLTMEAPQLKKELMLQRGLLSAIVYFVRTCC
jgi:hypothetical protein